MKGGLHNVKLAEGNIKTMESEKDSASSTVRTREKEMANLARNGPRERKEEK